MIRDSETMWTRTLRLALGTIFLILGIVGCFLPILQGWLFLLIAAVLFFPQHRKVESILKKAEPRWPRLVRFMRRIGVGDPEHPSIVRVEPSPESSSPS